VVIDLSHIEPEHDITPADLEDAAPEIRQGDIVLVRTGWTDIAWGEFPRYYVGSPSCSPEAATWLTETGAKAIGFDCFPERAAKKQSYAPYEFVVHHIIGESGAILMQSLTNLAEVPVDERFQFYGAFLNVNGAEGSPARFFAVLD
jgi:kynurenine formamidase